MVNLKRKIQSIGHKVLIDTRYFNRTSPTLSYLWKGAVGFMPALIWGSCLDGWTGWCWPNGKDREYFEPIEDEQ